MLIYRRSVALKATFPVKYFPKGLASMNRVAVLVRGCAAASSWSCLGTLGCHNFSECGPSASSSRSCCSSLSAQSAKSVRESLLDGALKHVAEHGWTDAALIAAARDLRLSPAVIGILPRGEGELVEHFVELCNTKCAKDLGDRQHELLTFKLNERVAKALRTRLEMLRPVIDTWPQALAVAARPSNAPHSVKLLFSLVDDIWAALGDRSTDVTWYSKRAVIAGVYASISLYMITDYSPGFRDTWEALQRRVDEGLALDASLEQVVHTDTSTSTATPP
ncbi:hypothetical protein Vretimale_13247 [Volvox reticuliferus]|uniref:Ubiquinone biosynthesis protein n=1 Tax=Volvox reticuliferus TaxID=1737510 RepID=A0A8J4FVB2_9CHLO|nr:hypothetical protein Vretifemale_14196 [Volvox reticuliferus]GIM09380.1 hypothetical protein Vretimale_13247 [Volvox reticuliferus]